MDSQLKQDFVTLGINEDEDKVTVRFVTEKYRILAKQKHPDRQGGNTVEFQDLQNAYKRLIKHLERNGEE